MIVSFWLDLLPPSLLHEYGFTGDGFLCFDPLKEFAEQLMSACAVSIYIYIYEVAILITVFLTPM